MKARIALLTATTCAVLAGSVQAHAATRPPSAADQYVEQIPTAAGGKATGSAADSKVAPSVQKKIQDSGGSDAHVLTEVASSAPKQPTTKAKAKAKPTTTLQDETRSTEADDVSLSRSASAAAETAGSATDTRVIGLGIALVAAVLLSVGLALARQRRRS